MRHFPLNDRPDLEEDCPKPETYIPDELRSNLRNLDYLVESLKEKIDEKDSEIQVLKEKLTMTEKQLERKDIIKQKNMEKLPWERVSIVTTSKLISSSLADSHLKLFERTLKNFAFCVDIEGDIWIWYQWEQRLWVRTGSRGLLPIMKRTIIGIESAMHEFEVKKSVHSKLLKDEYLLELITPLKLCLPDTGGIETKLNRNSELLPLKNGKVFNQTTKQERDRTYLDYFSYYYSDGKIYPATLENLSVQREIVPKDDVFKLFLESGEITITQKNTDKVNTASLHREFCKWCEDRDYINMSSQQITKIMTGMGVERKRFNNGQFWVGVKGKWLME